MLLLAGVLVMYCHNVADDDDVENLDHGAADVLVVDVVVRLSELFSSSLLFLLLMNIEYCMLEFVWYHRV